MKLYDIVGIGAGPSNLSLSALLKDNVSLSSLILDKNDDFIWHGGMLLENSELQVSYLKDLVTLVDPTNSYSFLSYLQTRGLIYQFINANFSAVKRKEFNKYLNWVYKRVGNIEAGAEVSAVNFTSNKYLCVETTKGKQYLTKNLVLGTGRPPYIPSISRNYIGEQVFHNSEYAYRNINVHNKRIAIVGGGQSGAEIFYDLISKEDQEPKEIVWISKRSNFLPLDETAFTNELFTPKYSQHFYSLEPATKNTLLNEQKLANQGISNDMIKKIYQKVYEKRFISDSRSKLQLLPGYELVGIDKTSECSVKLDLLKQENDRRQAIYVDYLILCTGYKYIIPAFLDNIIQYLNVENNKLITDKDYKVIGSLPSDIQIFLHNGSEHCHGIADPNLSLMAYRSATIINQIAKENVFNNIDAQTLIDWS